MFTYYDAIIFLSCAALAVMIVLVYENARMQPKAKRRHYFTSMVLIMAAMTEWLSVVLNGAPSWTRGLHAAIKGLDYVFTPIVGIAFILQIYRKGVKVRLIFSILVANLILQGISFFTGWTYYVDEENIYHHGPYYLLYMLIYAFVLLLVVQMFYEYSKGFKKQNKASLYLAVGLTVTGFVIQEASGGRLRVSYLSLALGSILLFIHSNEFRQMRSDDRMLQQKQLLETDTLTNLRSRFSYSQKLNEMEQQKVVPEDMVVFMMDINGLKEVNDTLGHNAGDELIMGMADCVAKTFQKYGACYRTGGDEFVVILQSKEEGLPARLCRELDQRVQEWSRGFSARTGLSYGYALAEDFPEHSVEKLISIADERMYRKKEAFYTGSRDRRRR